MNLFTALEHDLMRQFGEGLRAERWDDLADELRDTLNRIEPPLGSGPIPSPADSKDDEQGFVGGASYSRTER